VSCVRRLPRSKIVATYCVFVPEEIVLAAGVSGRVVCRGAIFRTHAEEVLPAILCPYQIVVRFKLGRVCPMCRPASDRRRDYLRRKKKMFEILNRYSRYMSWRCLIRRRYAAGHYGRMSNCFKDRIEELTENKITAEALGEAIKKVNGRRGPAAAA